MSTGTIIAGAAFVKLSLDNAELKKGLEAAQGKVQAFADRINAFSARMSMLGPILAVPVYGAAKAFAEFDDQMRLTAAVTGATGKEFESLTELAKKLGRETDFTAAQVAGGMVSLGRMGFNPQQIEATIKPMMDLSRATGTELPEAAEIAGNALRALGLGVSNTGNVADILTTTANGSAQTLLDLGEALKYAAPAARTAGEDIYDVNAALGILANVGIRGSLAGTALKRAYSELSKTDVQNYLKRFNVQVVDGQGNLRKYADILRDCVAAMQSMGTAEKLDFANQVFGERAAPSALAITADTSKLDEFMAKLKACRGAADRIAKQMNSGLGGSFRRLSSAAEGISIALGEIISKSFTPLIEGVSSFCLTVREAMGANQELVSGVLGLVGSFVGLGVAIKGMTMLAGGIKALFMPLTVLDALIVSAGRNAAASGAMAAAANAKATKSSLIRLAAQQGLSAATLFGVACSSKHASAVLAASISELVAARRGASASALKTAGYYAEAIAAKIAAGATVALKAALDLLLANPITVAFLALAAAIYGISRAAAAASEKLKKQAEAAKEAAAAATAARAAGDEQRQTADTDFKRLQQLEEISARGKLSAEQMAEAERLLNSLDPFGASNWAKLDKVTGQLTLAADAQRKFNDEMRAAAKLQLEAEIEKQRIALEKLKARLSDSGARAFFGDTTLGKVVTLGMVDSLDEHNAPINQEIDAEFKKLRAMEKRLRALKSGAPGSVTGQGQGTSGERIASESERRRAAMEEIATAEKELARMDEENAKKKMSQLEKEVYQIDQLKKKYIELAALKRSDLEAELRAAEKRMKDNQAGSTSAQVIAYREAFAAMQKAKSEISALDQRIQTATKFYDQQRADAQTRHDSKYTNFLADTDAKTKQQAAASAQDNKFNRLNSNRTPEGIRLLNEFIRGLGKELESAKERYKEMLLKFQGDGSEGGENLSDKERGALDRLQKEINAAGAKIQAYQSRINAGGTNAQNAQKALSSFSAQGLTNIFNRQGHMKETQEERIVRATEETAKNTRKIARKNNSNNLFEIG